MWYVGNMLGMALGPGITGLVIGGLIGYGCARQLRQLYERTPSARRWLVLVPWRAVVFMAAVLMLPPLLLPFGFVSSLAASAILFGLVLAAIPLAAAVITSSLLRVWQPLAEREALFAGGRTVLIGLMALGVLVSGMGSTPFIFSNNPLGLIGQALPYYAVVFLVTAVIDVVAGVVQRGAAGRPQAPRRL